MSTGVWIGLIATVFFAASVVTAYRLMKKVEIPEKKSKKHDSDKK